MVSNITALEIVSNPKDLQVSLSEDNFLLVSRGPGHNFKPLISGSLNEMEDPVSFLEDLLGRIVRTVHEKLKEKGSIFYNFFNFEDKSIEELEVLKISDIEKIMIDVRKSGIAKTFQEQVNP